MNSNLEVQQKIVENWLGNYHSVGNPWTLADSKYTGRGLIATRDINVNELILCEPPLIIGPVGSVNNDVGCVNCFKLISKIDLCSNCLLPMCSDCLKNCRHEECAFLQSLNLSEDGRSLQLVRSLTVIRGLFLNETGKRVLNLLQCNRTTETEKLIDDLLKQDNGRNNGLRNELVFIASVLRTNAFQIVVNLSSNCSLNLRGLYPLMSLINHSCTSNARYCTDGNHITSLFARKPIKMGEEILISYAKILWSTPSRQSFVKITKQFTCKCDRCMDPTEGSTFLAALKCLDRTCAGLVLPVDPMNFVSSWKCLTCSRLSEYKTVLRVQEVVSCMITGSQVTRSIQEIDEFINHRLLKVLPASNQYVVEMKMKIISSNVKDQPIKDWKLVEKYCQDVLHLLDRLQAGECMVKGLVEFKLFQCRQIIMDTGKYSTIEFESNQQKLLMNAWSTLKDNISAPADLASTVEKYVLCKVRIA